MHYTGRMRKTIQTLFLSSIILTLLIAHILIVIATPLRNVLGHAVASQKKTLSLVLKKEKTAGDIIYIQKSLAIAQRQSSLLAIFMKKLSRTVPLESYVEATNSMAAAFSQLPLLLGSRQESHYVLLFLNNYELRPGGGFIGSLGFITFKNYTLTRFETQDVYEIDGQLTTHHEPHYAVRKYLNQPNEYLRDSNFSPDFSLNTKKAFGYLSYVPSYSKQYNGAIGITTSAFEDLLRLTGPIELSDFQTTITSSNFFSTTQRKIENNFFPGSKQKRSILQALGNAVMQRLEDLPPSSLLHFLYNSVKTKGLVFYASNKQLQTFLRIMDATGEQSSSNKNWVMPIDANVGVNKLDALVHKTMELQLVQTSTSAIQTFKSIYTNSITSDASRKETYKNYFQLYVPNGAILRKAIVNNHDVTNEIRVSHEDNRKIFGIYLETPPASSTAIAITY